MPEVRPIRIGIVVLPRFTLTPFSVFLDAFRLASDEGDRSTQKLCRWSVLTPDPACATSSSGVRILADGRLEKPERFDYVAVVGGLLEDRYRSDPAVERFLREAAEAGCTLIGLCTGSMALAQAGLLDRKRCCVSWFHRFDLIEAFPDIEPVADRLFLIDGKRITSAGGVGSVQVALWIIERHLGPAIAGKCRRILMVESLPRMTMPQPVRGSERIRDHRIQRAALLIEEDLSREMTTDGIARHVHLSKRQLERLFVRDCGVTPARYRKETRLIQARAMIEQSPLPISSIAIDCGFQSLTHFSREFRKLFGCPPSSLRSTISGDSAGSMR